MRLHRIALIALSCLALPACTQRVGLADLMPRPSQEVTASINRAPTPTPSEPVARAAPTPPASVAAAAPVGTLSLVEEQEIQIAIPEPEARVEQVAVVVPPAPRPSGSTRMASPTDRKIHAHRFRDAKPINFGKTTPRNYPVHGVDVSRWQGEIDWVKLRSQGANFVFIKATDGGDHLDPMFRKNWRESHAAGLKRGAYHFFYWCRTAGEQADWFIRNVPKVAGALPPVIDVEWNGESRCKKRPSRDTVLEKMRVFMDKLEAHYGQRPIIYTAPDFYRDNLRGAFPNHPFWLRAVAQHPSKVYPNRKWVFWQYSGSGLSKGVTGKIDLNVFHASEKEWHRWVDRETLVAAD